jgi:hypothetical protein
VDYMIDTLRKNNEQLQGYFAVANNSI